MTACRIPKFRGRRGYRVPELSLPMIARRIDIVLVALGAFCAAAGLPVAGMAQRFRVERITPEQGLSQSFVHCVMQDSRGFMWFGTRDGLNKYDGYKFIVHRPRPFDSSSLSVNVITSIAEDSSGAIWAGTYFHGLNRLERSTGKVRRYGHRPRDPHSLSGNTIGCILVDRKGDLWVGTPQGLNLYRKESDDFTRFSSIASDPSTLAHDSVEFIEEDPSGALWIGGGDIYISRFDRTTRRFTRFTVVRAGNHPAGTRFIGDDPVVFRASCSLATVRSYILRSDIRISDNLVPVEDMLKRQGRQAEYLRIEPGAEVWLRGSPFNPGYSGLYFIPLPLRGAAVSLPEPIIRGNITSLYRDRSGIYWVGTEDGIFRLMPIARTIVTYRHYPSDPGSLSHSRIRSVHEDRGGRLWVGTDEGMNRLDERSGGWIRYYTDTVVSEGPAGNVVNVIYEERDGTLLAGTNDGIRRYDPAHDRFLPYVGVGNGAGGRTLAVWSMYRDRNGLLWAGTKNEGILLFGPEGKIIRRYRSTPGDTNGIADNRVWCMGEDRSGSLWIGTNDGLHRWSPASGRFIAYRHDPGRPRGICGNNIWSLNFDSDSNLWVGAYGGGLSRYHPETDDFTSVTTNEGLPSDAVFGALSDRRGRLWVSTSNGLALYSPAERRVLRTYGAADGLQGNEFSFKAFHKTSDGEMFFGGLNGLSRFRPEDIRDNTNIPRLAITSFRVFDSVVAGELFDGAAIEVDYSRNFVSFEFAALDYTNPAQNRYSYMLEGVDPTWVECGSRRYVSYSDLDPGEYVLHVRGSNNDGAWNRAGVSISLRVLPPFWMTIWFRIIVGAALTLAVVLILHYRVAAVRRREKLRRQILESQLQALQAQMNPHFIFNALNSIHQLILDRSDDDAAEYLAKFAHLVRIVLDHSCRRTITVAEEVEYLTIYLELESLRFDGRLD